MATTSGTLYANAWYSPSYYCGENTAQFESWLDWWVERDDPSSYVTVHVTRIQGRLFGDAWSDTPLNDRQHFWRITDPIPSSYSIFPGVSVRNNVVCGWNGRCTCDIYGTWTGDNSKIVKVPGNQNYITLHFGGQVRPLGSWHRGTTTSGQRGECLADGDFACIVEENIPIPQATAPTIQISSDVDMGEVNEGDTITWATMSWNSTTRGNYSKLTRVELLLGTSEDPSDVVWSKTYYTTASTSGYATYNSCTVGSITYYYRFRVTNSNGLVGLSEIRSFTTPAYIEPVTSASAPLLKKKSINYNLLHYQSLKYKEQDYIIEPIAPKNTDHKFLMQQATIDKNVFGKTIDPVIQEQGEWYI